MPRLIDAERLKDVMIETLEKIKQNPKMDNQEAHIISAFHTVGLMVDDAPTIDAVQIVRCKDCKYSYAEELKISSQQGYLENRHIRFCKYELPTLVVADIHFCSCGERKDDESHPFADDVMMGERKDNGVDS